MELHRDPLTPYAERIGRVLDHIFGAAPPHTDSRERSRSLLQLLVDEFDKLIQLRKVRIPQLAISDNGSTSSTDHSGMVSTPEDGQQWSQWPQPEPIYAPTFNRRDLPPVSDGVWWPIPAQQGILCGSTDAYVGTPHDDYSYALNMGPA